MLIGSTSRPDPNWNNPASGPDIGKDTKLVSLRANQRPDPSVRNLGMAIIGQSNGTDVCPSIYTPNRPSQVDQMNLSDGGVYNAIDPMLSVTGVGGCPFLRLADNFTSSLFDRVMILNGCAGGTSIADWETGLQSGKIPMMVNRLQAKGWVDGLNVKIIFILCQGEQDTNLGTSQAAYTASGLNVIAQSRNAGFFGTWFIPQAQTWYMGAASAAVAAAQAALVNHAANVWEGPNMDALVGTACGGVACRQADNLHLADAGSSSGATAWQTSMHLYGSPF